jgi:hypothetical protein
VYVYSFTQIVANVVQGLFVYATELLSVGEQVQITCIVRCIDVIHVHLELIPVLMA